MNCNIHFIIIFQKTQSLADQAWEKVRAAGTLQHGLEDECIQLNKQIKKVSNRGLYV